ncbi:hypothetical protein [Delftia sp.]|uniref:hypothetical protein n=1 Tax=Delftia sp. TaxID=1886637 RepID=UPI00259D09DC|nr:hypothetical protein [Delftia sp.]
MNPAIAPIADAIMQGAGYQQSGRSRPVDVAAGGPAPQPGGPGAAGDIDQVRENTDLRLAHIPQEPSRGMQGIRSTAPAPMTACRRAADPFHWLRPAPPSGGVFHSALSRVGLSSPLLTLLPSRSACRCGDDLCASALRIGRWRGAEALSSAAAHAALAMTGTGHDDITTGFF